MLLSVIIPYRSTEKLPYIADRIIEKCHFRSNDEIEFVFVDSGSTWRRGELKDRIEEHNKYVRLNTENDIFSIGLCRNEGALAASGDVITFMDADYDCDDSMFISLMEMIRAKRVDKNRNEFFILPCIFLSEAGTSQLEKYPKIERRMLALNDLLTGNNKYVKFFGLVSSAIVVNRSKYLALGGNRREMFGHGYEDFEFLFRLLNQTGRIERVPENILHGDKTWLMTKYKGYRAYFTIMAREALANGLFMVHNWHGDMPKEYENAHLINKEKLLNYISDIENGMITPPPLSIERNKKVLLIDGSLQLYRDILPYLGNLVMLPGEYFFQNDDFDEQSFFDFISRNSIDLVLIANPYGNNFIYKIYTFLRNNNINHLCMERGALPDSWSINDGLNTDASSFDEDKWKRRLSGDEKRETERYITQVLNGAKFLEWQGKRYGGNALKTRLGLQSEQILFVPLQNRNSTNMRYFAGNAKSLDNFIAELSKLSFSLQPLGWKIVCKKHPQDNAYDLPANLIAAANDTNIMDLLEMADAVALINSGIGLYAMMMEKPCFVFGNAFFQHRGLNYRAESMDTLLDFIKNGTPVFDREKMLSFLHYLITTVYSFGHSKNYVRYNIDGTNQIQTESIDFYKINTCNVHLKFDSKKPMPILKNGLAFDQFRNFLSQQ